MTGKETKTVLTVAEEADVKAVEEAVMKAGGNSIVYIHSNEELKIKVEDLCGGKIFIIKNVTLVETENDEGGA